MMVKGLCFLRVSGFRCYDQHFWQQVRVASQFSLFLLQFVLGGGYFYVVCCLFAGSSEAKYYRE